MPQCPPRPRRALLPRSFPGISRSVVTSFSGGGVVVQQSEYRAQLVEAPRRLTAESQVKIVELPNTTPVRNGLNGAVDGGAAAAGQVTSESSRPTPATAKKEERKQSPAGQATKRKAVDVKEEAAPAKKAKLEPGAKSGGGEAKPVVKPVFKTISAKSEPKPVKTEKLKASPSSKVSDSDVKTSVKPPKAKSKPPAIGSAEKKTTKSERAVLANGDPKKQRGRPKKSERSTSESGSCHSEASSVKSSRSSKARKAAPSPANGALPAKEARRKSSGDRLLVDVASLCRRTPTDLAKTKRTPPPPRLTDSPAPHAVRVKPKRPRVVPGLTARKSISPDLPPSEPEVALPAPPVPRRGRKARAGDAEPKRKRRTDRQPSAERLLAAPRPHGGQRWCHAWSFQGEGQMKKILLRNDNQMVERLCYPSMRHQEGDEIHLRDCVLLRSGQRDEMPFVGKVAAIFQNPEDNEMLVSLLWYYRPDHTEESDEAQQEPGQETRPPPAPGPGQELKLAAGGHELKSVSPAEVFASKHRDTNSVACIEDKCFVLTWNEYCRYVKFLAQCRQGISSQPSEVPEALDEYPRASMLPPARVAPDRIFFCRRVYDFKSKRILKNPA